MGATSCRAIRGDVVRTIDVGDPEDRDERDSDETKTADEPVVRNVIIVMLSLTT